MGTTELSLEEKCTFRRDGLVVRRGFVPPTLVEQARRHVDWWYRSSMDLGAMASYTQTTFAPELASHPDLLALYYGSGLKELAACLVSPGTLAAVRTVQIQIRVPDTQLAVPQPAKAMHVDGVACPHLDPKELRTFTLLAGVALSEINDADAGALRYISGGHHQMAEWFRAQWTPGAVDQVPPDIDTQVGAAFLGAPGDALVMHHLVPHAVGRNRTDTPRVMAYFRVKHAQHDEHVVDALRDPWLEYPALRDHTF